MARKELLRIQDAVQKDRLVKKDNYCLFMKLAAMIERLAAAEAPVEEDGEAEEAPAAE